MNFQDQHYEHKPHFEYRVEYINKEHETFMYSMFIVNDDDEF
jgi:hypothetical protein